jgi:8-oxo-dGTP pyrophosphatase MutT (NUDIX family)
MKLMPQISPRNVVPRDVIFPVRSFDLIVEPGDHPFFVDNRTAIAENWSREVAANPHLYDGQMVLQRAIGLDGDHLTGRAHMVPFSTFLYWRRERMPAATHLFALPVIASSDGAVIAIRMGEKTANPGRVYCAAGSLDAHDVIDGRIDLDFNMRREVAEETGLDLDSAAVSPGYQGYFTTNTMTIFRIFRFDLSEAELLDRIAGHVARDPDPEISGAIGIRSADPTAHDYAYFMPTILDHVLSRGNPS